MRVSSVHPLPRLAAFATAAILALTLAACSDPVGPGEAHPQRAKGDSVSVLQRVHQLDGTTTISDTSSRTPTLPWY